MSYLISWPFYFFIFQLGNFNFFRDRSKTFFIVFKFRVLVEELMKKVSLVSRTEGFPPIYFTK